MDPDITVMEWFIPRMDVTISCIASDSLLTSLLMLVISLVKVVMLPDIASM